MIKIEYDTPNGYVKIICENGVDFELSGDTIDIVALENAFEYIIFVLKRQKGLCLIRNTRT